MTEELSEYMDQYLELNAQIKSLKEIKENLKAKILIDIKTNDIDRFEANGNRLTFKSMTRRSLNKEKLGNFLATKDASLEEFETESNYEMLRIVKLDGGE